MLQLKLFPVTPGAKGPVSDFNDWQTKANNDPAQIAAWREQYPGCNWAAPAGPNNLWVLDLDGEEAENALAKLEIEHEALPDTYTVRTPRGGRHLYFRGRGPTTTGKLGPKIDTRGGYENGTSIGYVLLPGSRTADGSYSVEHDRPIAEVPDWIVAKAGPQRGKLKAEEGVKWDEPHNIKRAEEYVRRLKPAAEGGRNDAVFKAVAQLYDFAVSPGIAEALVEEYNGRSGDPLPQEEVDVIFWSVYTQGNTQNGPGAAAIVSASDAFAAYAEAASSGIPDKTKSRRYALSASDFEVKPLKPIQYLWEGFYFENHVNLNWGDGGSGKTLMMEQLAVAVAAGYDLFGYKTKQMPVTLVLAEDDEAATRDRMRRICADRKLNFADLPIDFFNMQGEDATLVRIDREGVATFGDFLEDLTAHMKERPGSFVGLDTMVDIADLDQNLQGPVSKLCKLYLQGLCMNLKQTILVNAHPSKAAIDSGAGYAGSTAWKASVRAMTGLRRPGVKDREDDPRRRFLARLKNNFAGDSAEMELWMDGGLLRTTSITGKTKEQERADVLRFIHDNVEKRLLKYNRGSGVGPREAVTIFEELNDYHISEASYKAHCTALETQDKVWYEETNGRDPGRGWLIGIHPKRFERMIGTVAEND